MTSVRWSQRAWIFQVLFIDTRVACRWSCRGAMNQLVCTGMARNISEIREARESPVKFFSHDRAKRFAATSDDV